LGKAQPNNFFQKQQGGTKALPGAKGTISLKEHKQLVALNHIAMVKDCGKRGL
jgi:vacuolar-type H+-ATPase catalytic subunit A/Vma1